MSVSQVEQPNNASMEHNMSVGDGVSPVNGERQMSLNINVANAATRHTGPAVGQ